MVISIGQTPMTPIVTSWLTTNLGGYAKRAVAVAMFLLSSSIAGALGPQLYKSKDGPQYRKNELLYKMQFFKTGSFVCFLPCLLANGTKLLYVFILYTFFIFFYLVKGHLLNIGCMLVVIAFTLLQRWMLKRENNRRNYSVSFGVNPLKYLSKAELRDLNDKHPAFRYNL